MGNLQDLNDATAAGFAAVGDAFAARTMSQVFSVVPPSDCTAQFNAWKAGLGGNGGQGYVPAGSYHFADTLVFDKSFMSLFLAPGAYFVFDFDTSVKPWMVFGDDLANPESIFIRGGIFGGNAQATSKHAIECRRGHKFYFEDCKFSSAYDLFKYGNGASTDGLQPGETRLINCSGGAARHGIVAYGGAGLYLLGTTLNGLSDGGGFGIHILADLDGLFVDSESNLDRFDYGIVTEHTAGNVANVFCLGHITFTKFDVFRVALSGSAGLNGVHFDPESVSISPSNVLSRLFRTVGTSTGELRVTLCPRRTSYIYNELVLLTDTFESLKVEIIAENNGANPVGAVPAINLGGFAHKRVEIDAMIEGAYTYGLANAASVIDGDFTVIAPNAVTGKVNAVGSRTSRRRFNVAGTRQPLTGCEAFALGNVAASEDSSPYFVAANNVGAVVGVVRGQDGWPAPCAGRITWASVDANPAVTQGSITVLMYKNNSPTGVSFVLTVGDATKKTITFDDDDLLFAVGDTMGMRIQSTSNLLPAATIEGMFRWGWEETSVTGV